MTQNFDFIPDDMNEVFEVDRNNIIYELVASQIFRTVYHTKDVFRNPFSSDFNVEVYYAFQTLDERDNYLKKYVSEDI